jgi:hypothetical protein
MLPKPLVMAEEMRRLKEQPGTTPAPDLTSKYRAWAERPDVSLFRLANGSVLIDEGWGGMVLPSEAQLMKLLGFDPGAEFTKPFGERAGVEGDQNVAVFLLAAPPAPITEALRPLAAGVVTGALGREVSAAEICTFVFRWEGHPWSTVLRHELWGETDAAVRAALLELSRREACELIEYDASDTTGGVGYALFAGGAEIERLSAADGEKPEFTSKRRKIPPARRKDPHAIVAEFFVEQRAYVSSISPAYFLDRAAAGTKVKVQNPGTTLQLSDRTVRAVPGFETVDYLWFAGRRPRLFG